MKNFNHVCTCFTNMSQFLTLDCLPAQVRPTTVQKMIDAAPPTALMKKNLNSAFVRKD